MRVGENGRPPRCSRSSGDNRLPLILEHLADEDAFLSPHGIRALSAEYRGRPYVFSDAGTDTVVDYEPAESTTGLFGGNSNWRGPIWFPVNYLVIGALLRFSQGLGDDFTVEFPTGSGRPAHAAGDHDRPRGAPRRDLPPARGRDAARCSAAQERFRDDPAWRDALLFHEYFHGDDGAGLGASHQTGWTGLVADLVIRLSWAREQA